jgi:uncharacterized protein
MSEEKNKLVADYTKNIMSKLIAHGYYHVNRVRNWALLIAKNEGFKDLEMIEFAALLHDIGLAKAEKRSQHGEVGAAMAEEFLKENNLLTPEKITEVCLAIKFHCTNRGGEGKLLAILRDADMMDLFGGIGIMRAFTSNSTKLEYDLNNIKGETWQMRASDFDERFDSGIGIGEYLSDQINFQISCYDNLNTETARKIAKPLVDMMSEFMIKMEDEINLGQQKG